MVVTFVDCCPIFPATSRILGADGQTHSEKVYEKQAVILFHGVSLLCTAWNYICSFVLAQRITITLQLNRFVVVLFIDSLMYLLVGTLAMKFFFFFLIIYLWLRWVFLLCFTLSLYLFYFISLLARKSSLYNMILSAPRL